MIRPISGTPSSADPTAHAGTDIVSSYHPDDGHVIEVNQDQYIEAIADFPLAAVSGRALDDPLTDREVSQCRAALSLQ